MCWHLKKAFLLKKLLQAIRKIKPPVFCYVIYTPLCYNMPDGRKLTLYSFEVLPTGADLPKAFTSRRLSASPPLSIWTITYLPDASWPGISAMIISQFEFDLRWWCVAHQCQVQQNGQRRCHQKTSGFQRSEAHPRCGHRHFEFVPHSNLVGWRSQPGGRWLRCRSQWQARV